MENTLEEKKQVLLEIINHKDYKPMKIKELGILLSINGDDEKRAMLEETLEQLIAEGKIIKTKRGKYARPEAVNMIVGKFIAHAKGFGFVEIEGEENDIFIPAPYVNGAFNNDTVAIKLIRRDSKGKRKEGEVIKIIKRNDSDVIGTYQKSKNFGFVVADNKKFTKDIFISKNKSKGAVSGHKVVVKITDWGNERRNPEGEIIEIIGHINDPGTDILSIVRSYELPMQFPDAVMNQLDYIPSEVTEEDKAGRLDLREIQMVTIDGEDAKDLDDAITIQRNEDGTFTLGVHIADVTNYVTEGSPLDVEALRRGTSVYLVDRVIPMLPHKLSNGICSLNMGTDRLALSCLMDIDKKGNVVNHKIAETLINVDRRMTYTNVRKILSDKDQEVISEYKDFVKMFEEMEELAAILRDKRKRRGSIDFDFAETKVILNEKGEPIDIIPYDRNVATKIIEEFMLLANETIAEDFFWQELPFVYRTHEEPDPERLATLASFIHNFGYNIKGEGEIHPKEIQKLLIEIEGKPEEAIISRLALRSMKRACYTVTGDGHYGLATKYYTHFTSPIRRYPDLQIHRIIKENLNGKMEEKRIRHFNAILPNVAKQTSETERTAEEAERETIKLKKVQYMEKHIGEKFEGVISGVTAWGLYVELPNTVEGLVHVTTLDDDYYIFDEKKHIFIGERTSKIYRMGEPVKIAVLSVNKVERTIDFELVSEDTEEEE
ncbi:ribonuclease R [Vallitalea guaymasensis]|uniref:Ribonuclease R n=1 Tax=Vallitalea guaymasensis TaxID=1185412 RepID=A0A8J8MDD0_9FIRM|nr:ribonuclease R [Vallitalea guaymasensis]QUH30769.1 ribonuclease R [Vallitalea guaymasensis]